MRSAQIFTFKSPEIIKWGDNIFDQFLLSLKLDNIDLQDGDIIVITSKVFSMMQQSAVQLDKITPSEKAHQLGLSSLMDPRVAQLVIDESNGEILGSVPHAILAKTPYGLSANAGIDLSNSPAGFALILPRNPDEEAEKFRQAVKMKFNIDVAVLIIDSRTIPLRKGTTAVALGVAGMEPIIDERGQEDLYGKKMVITTRSIADGVATAVNLLMGETNEQCPFGIMRGIEYNKAETVSIMSTLMPEDQCLYFAPFIKLLNRETVK